MSTAWVVAWHPSPSLPQLLSGSVYLITLILHIQPLPSLREMYRMLIFSATHNHAPSSPAALTASPPHVHTTPMTAPRVSLLGASPILHARQHASDQGKRVWNDWKPFPSSSCKFTSPLLLSLSVTSLPLSSSSLSRYSCFTLLFSLPTYIQA